MAQNQTIKLCSLTAEDIVAAQTISGSFGWPHRQEDWEFMLDLGCGFAARNEQNKLVGAAMWWEYGDLFVTLGMLVVSHDMQRQGIGRLIMRAIMEEAGERTVILNATDDGKVLYQSLGFGEIGHIQQHQGYVNVNTLESIPDNGRIRKITKDDILLLCQIDEGASGMPRMKLIESLFRVGEGFILEYDGSPVGFSFRRPFGRGTVIGPVVAQNVGAAYSLVAAHMKLAEGSFARIDIPSQHKKMGQWLTRASLIAVSSATTMILGRRPSLGAKSRVFAISNQALG